MMRKVVNRELNACFVLYHVDFCRWQLVEYLVSFGFHRNLYELQMLLVEVLEMIMKVNHLSKCRQFERNKTKYELYIRLVYSQSVNWSS